jgi:hypothetical protein
MQKLLKDASRTVSGRDDASDCFLPVDLSSLADHVLLSLALASCAELKARGFDVELLSAGSDAKAVTRTMRALIERHDALQHVRGLD